MSDADDEGVSTATLRVAGETLGSWRMQIFVRQPFSKVPEDEAMKDKSFVPNASFEQACGRSGLAQYEVPIEDDSQSLQCVDKILVMKDGLAAAFGPKNQVLASLIAPAKAPTAAITVPRDAAKKLRGFTCSIPDHYAASLVAFLLGLWLCRNCVMP